MILALGQVGSALGIIPQDVLPAPSLIAEEGVELIRNGRLVDAVQVKYSAAVGLDPKVAQVSQAPSLRLPTEFAVSGQIQSSPRFADWIDRRYNDALRPLFNSAN